MVDQTPWCFYSINSLSGKIKIFIDQKKSQTSVKNRCKTPQSPGQREEEHLILIFKLPGVNASFQQCCSESAHTQFKSPTDNFMALCFLFWEALPAKCLCCCCCCLGKKQTVQKSFVFMTCSYFCVSYFITVHCSRSGSRLDLSTGGVVSPHRQNLIGCSQNKRTTWLKPKVDRESKETSSQQRVKDVSALDVSLLSLGA